MLEENKQDWADSDTPFDYKIIMVRNSQTFLIDAQNIAQNIEYSNIKCKQIQKDNKEDYLNG